MALRLEIRLPLRLQSAFLSLPPPLTSRSRRVLFSLHSLFLDGSMPKKFGCPLLTSGFPPQLARLHNDPLRFSRFPFHFFSSLFSDVGPPLFSVASFESKADRERSRSLSSCVRLIDPLRIPRLAQEKWNSAPLLKRPIGLVPPSFFGGSSLPELNSRTQAVAFVESPVTVNSYPPFRPRACRWPYRFPLVCENVSAPWRPQMKDT